MAGGDACREPPAHHATGRLVPGAGRTEHVRRTAHDVGTGHGLQGVCDGIEGAGTQAVVSSEERDVLSAREGEPLVHRVVETVVMLAHPAEPTTEARVVLPQH